jgi:hypothetical protein
MTQDVESQNTLDAIVRSVLIDTDEDIDKNYAKYLHWAIECYREGIVFDMPTPCLKSVVIPMNDYNAIDFPFDYIDWCSIGLVNGDHITRLSESIDSINNTFQKDGLGNDIANGSGGTDYPGTGVGMGNYQIQTWFYGGYGIPQTDVFSVDNTRRQFIFKSRFKAGKIYLKYLATVAEANSVVHPYCASVIRAYLHLKKAQMGGASNMGLMQLKSREYTAELTRLRSRLSNLTPEFFRNLVKANYTMVNKI